MLSYWFYPNPGNADYTSPKVMVLLLVLAALFLFSFMLSRWRKRHPNSVTKKLTRTWPGMMRALAIIGLVLVVCRVEEIQFFAMRALWLLWLMAFVAYALFQLWMWRKRHYTIVRTERVEDPRDKYLPK